MSKFALSTTSLIEFTQCWNGGSDVLTVIIVESVPTYP